MKTLFASAFGSFLKAFITAIMTLYLTMLTDKGAGLFSMDMKMIERLLTAGVVSTLPLIINYLNPTYVQYDINKAVKQEKNKEEKSNTIPGAVGVIIFIIALSLLCSFCYR